MCARYRLLLGALGALTLAASAAAQDPGISPDSTEDAAPIATTAPATTETASPATAPPSPVPAFTPGPEPAFTGGAPPPPPAPVAYPVYAAAPAPPPDPHAGDQRWKDAHVDRVLLVPTAETHPAGTWYLSSYEVLLLQLGYALSDRAQLSFTIFPYFTKDPLIPMDLTLKAVLMRRGRARVAAMGSATGLLGYQSTEAIVGRMGGVVQLCFDDACRSSVSTTANAVLAGSLILMDGIGAIVRTSDSVALLLEAESVLPLSRNTGQINALAGAFGVRFSGRSWGIDLALGGPLDRRTKPQLLPFLAATYRFLP